MHTHIHTNRQHRPTYPISSPISLRLRWANTRCITVLDSICQNRTLFVNFRSWSGSKLFAQTCLSENLGIGYHKLRKTFSKFYRRHYELVSKFNVGLKTLLHQGLSEPEFYGDLVYKFKKLVGRADFSDQFKEIIVHYKRTGYNISILQQSACLELNRITVNNFASLFNCTPVGRASDSMMALT